MARRLVFIVLGISLLFSATGVGLGKVAYAKNTKHAVRSVIVDTCLRGQWRELSFSEDTEIVGDGRVTLSGAGRKIRFDRGTETVDYGAGVTYEGRTSQHRVSVERSGTASYRVRADGNQLIFTGVAADGVERILVNGEELSRQPIGLASAPLRFECRQTTLVFTEPGYRSTFERLRPEL